MALLPEPAVTQGLIGTTPTITNVALGQDARLPAGLRIGVALSRDEAAGMAPSIIVWVFDALTGRRVGAPLTIEVPPGVTPEDIIYSTYVKPGSVLVLDGDSNVREFMIAFDRDGSPTVAGSVVHDGGGTCDASLVEYALLLALIAVVCIVALIFLGEDAEGKFERIDKLVDASTWVSVADLTVVPQEGNPVIVALVDERDGQQHLVGVRPPDRTSDPPKPPEIVFDLTPIRCPIPCPDPPPPFMSLAGPPPPYDSMPLREPTEVHLIAANGTGSLYRLTIQPNPHIGGSFQIEALEGAHVPIARVAAGSLAMVPFDGAGVLYDPGFQLDGGGLSGRLFTLLGDSVEVSPKSLNLSTNGRFVTAVIETGAGDVSGILPRGLEVNGGTVPPSLDFTPQVGDADGDGNPDLTVKFDRAAVQVLLPTGMDSALVKVVWELSDGSSDGASAELKIVQ